MEFFASGRLVMDPIEKHDRGVQYLSFTMVSDIVLSGGGTEAVWIDVAVDGHKMARAVRLKKRDGIWARGPVTLRRYTANGEERTAWQMQCNELITHRETYEA